jgi:vacuole morphology and inheritance protein 14
VEALVAQLARTGQLERVFALVDTLARTYALSAANVHARKGGLLCLAAAAVGLAAAGSDAVQGADFLGRAVPPVLASFTDADSRVRYYALEALYNVAKSARPGILAFFPDVFDALLRLCGDADVSVQNATAFTSALMKDCLAESPGFEFASLMPTLEAALGADSSAKRQFVLGWLSLLDSLPAAELPLLRALPRLLPGMLDALDDPAPEVRQAADRLLRELAAAAAAPAPAQTDPAALAASAAGALRGAQPAGAARALMALHWLAQLVAAAPARVAGQLPAVLSAVLACLDSADVEISWAAEELDAALLASDILVGGADVGALMAAAAAGLGHQEAGRLAALRWAHALLQRDPAAALRHTQAMLAGLCDALPSASDAVVQETASVLVGSAARCCVRGGGEARAQGQGLSRAPCALFAGGGGGAGRARRRPGDGGGARLLPRPRGRQDAAAAGGGDRGEAVRGAGAHPRAVRTVCPAGGRPRPRLWLLHGAGALPHPADQRPGGPRGRAPA